MRRVCISVLLVTLIYSSSFRVSADNDTFSWDETELRFNTINDGFAEVEYEVARAVFMPPPSAIARGEVSLHCKGLKAIKDRIYWLKDGQPVNEKFVDDPNEALFRSIYTLNDDDEAYYSCNGVGMYVIKRESPKQSQELSVWEGTRITCIDAIANEEATSLERMDGSYKTEITFYYEYARSMYPVKDRKVTMDMTLQCNNTAEYSFVSERRPETTVHFEGKKAICRSTDNLGRCQLYLYFGRELKVTGVSPELQYSYGSINIQDVSCRAVCDIGGGADTIALETKSIEINRPLFIGIICLIIFLIILVILVVCCVLWYKFGMKEKYGYQVQMRLKKNFAVDGNKLSSYRLSGVEAAGADEDSEGPDVKEFRDYDEGGSVEEDSFVDPNYNRHPNHKGDLGNKAELRAPLPAQKPFLRI